MNIMRSELMLVLGLVFGSTALHAQVVLEDFNSGVLRKNNLGLDLFSLYTGEGPNQTSSLVNGAFQVKVGAASFPYVQFVPITANNPRYPYATPCLSTNCGRMSAYVLTNNYVSGLNRLRFRSRCDINLTRASSGGDMLHVGTYEKQPDNPDPQTQGQHFYHGFNPNLYSGKWIWFTVHDQPSHQVGGVAKDYSPDPLGDLKYWDGVNRFYMDWFGNASSGAWVGSTCDFDDFTLFTATNEADDWLYNTTATHSGTRYEVGWDNPVTPAGLLLNYQVRYSTQSLKTIGFSNGQSGGTVSNTRTTYRSVMWTSPAMCEGPAMYVGVRPMMQISHVANTSPIAVTTTHFHGLSEGDTVTIAGVGGATAANGNWTVTPIHNTFSIANGGLTNVTVTSKVATVTTSREHGMWVGAVIHLVGSTSDTYLTNYFKVTSVPSPTTFTFAAPNVADGVHTESHLIIRHETAFTLNGSSGNANYTSGGTATATTENTNFTEIPIPKVGLPCDVNGDNTVDANDVTAAINATLNSSCCGNLDGSGACNVVQVQRVVNAVAGSACKVGP